MKLLKCWCFLFVCLAGIAHASVDLDQWRSDAAAVRALTENDVPQARAQALRLQAAFPADATPADRVRLLNLLARIDAYLARPEKAANHARLALDLAQQHDDREGQIEALLNLALNAVNQAKINTTIAATTRSLELLDGVSRPDLLGEALLQGAMMYRRLGRLDDAVNVAMKSLDIAKRSGHPLALAYAHHGLCTLFGLSDRPAEARAHCLEMRDHARVAGSKLLEALATLSLGHEAERLGERLGDSAGGERLVQEAMAMFRAIGAPFALAHGTYGFADLLRNRGRHAEAVRFLDQEIAIYRKYPNRIGLWYALNARAANFEALGRVVAARTDVEKSFVLAQGIDSPIYLNESRRQMAAVAAAAGDYPRAYRLAAAAAAIADKAAGESAGTRVLELVRRYERESRQREVDELKRHNERQAEQLREHALTQRWLWTVLGGSTAMLAGIAFFLHRLRQAHRKLRAVGTKLEMLNFAVGFVHEAIYLTDRDDRIIYVNAEACRALGYRRDELLAMTGRDIDADAGTEDDVRMTKHVSADEAQTFEGRHKAKDGRVFAVEIFAAAFSYLGEQVTIALARDVTERKRLEAALIRREQEFRTLAESSPDAIVRYDRDGRIRYLNGGLADCLGVAPAVLIGKRPVEVWPDGRYAAIDEAIVRALKTEKEVTAEFTETTATGKLLFNQIRVVPERDANGQTVGAIAFGCDITDLKRYAQSLLERAKLQEQISSVALAVTGFLFTIRVDAHGHTSIPYASAGVEELFGLRPEDIRADAAVLRARYHPEDLPRVLDLMTETERTLEPFRIEIRIAHPQKGERWIEIRSTPRRQSDGATEWHGQMNDITERKETESARRESEEMLRSLFELSPVGIALTDRQGRFLEFNEAFRAMCGYSVDELRALDRWTLTPAEYHAQTAEQLESMARTGRYGPYEKECTCKSGERIAIRLIGSMITGKDGQPLTWTLVEDITERKRLVEALGRSEREFRTLAENGPDSIARYDRECRLNYINPQLAATLGVPTAELLGKTAAQRRPDGSFDDYEAALKETMASGQPRDHYLVLHDAVANEPRHHHVRMTPEKNERGEATGVLVFGRDMTATWETERALEESRAQLRSLAAHADEVREEERRRIAREVHDELGQVLTGLRLNVSRLERHFGADLPPLRERLQETMALTDMALGAARGIVSALRPAALDMGIGVALEWQTEAFGANTGIRCETQIDGDIQFDDRHSIVLYRVVQESLTNVARHARADSVSIALNKDAGDCVLTVRDDGIGFDTGAIDAKSFGLLGIRERVLALNGTVLIDSRPGGGTQMTVRIPVQD